MLSVELAIALYRCSSKNHCAFGWLEICRRTPIQTPHCRALFQPMNGMRRNEAPMKNLQPVPKKTI